MHALLNDLAPERFVERVTGLAPEHPLFAELVAVVGARAVA
jgi:mannitol-1-phosphate 5-dehydrogenase